MVAFSRSCLIIALGVLASVADSSSINIDISLGWCGRHDKAERKEWYVFL